MISKSVQTTDETRNEDESKKEKIQNNEALKFVAMLCY